MTKSANIKTTSTHQPSDKPGGYMAYDELDRANAFASMRLALEAALAGDRNAVSDAVREAVATYAPEFASHRTALLEAVALIGITGRTRDLENVMASKIEFFTWGESATLGTVPRHPDADQLHAAELAGRIKAETDRFRVRSTNY